MLNDLLFLRKNSGGHWAESVLSPVAGKVLSFDETGALVLVEPPAGFSGDAGDIISGTLDDARLSGNVVLLDGDGSANAAGFVAGVNGISSGSSSGSSGGINGDGQIYGSLLSIGNDSVLVDSGGNVDCYSLTVNDGGLTSSYYSFPYGGGTLYQEGDVLHFGGLELLSAVSTGTLGALDGSALTGVFASVADAANQSFDGFFHGNGYNSLESFPGDGTFSLSGGNFTGDVDGNLSAYALSAVLLLGGELSINFDDTIGLLKHNTDTMLQWDFGGVTIPDSFNGFQVNAFTTFGAGLTGQTATFAAGGGFFGVSVDTQPTTPLLLADVITVLQAWGLCL